MNFNTNTDLTLVIYDPLAQSNNFEFKKVLSLDFLKVNNYGKILYHEFDSRLCGIFTFTSSSYKGFAFAE